MSTSRAESEPDSFRPADVCARLDVQPYILKFWESEFPLLGRRVGSKRLYDAAAVEMVKAIRRLVLDERRSLADVRAVLDTRFGEPEVDAHPIDPPVTASGAVAADAEGRAALLERELAAAQEALRRIPSLQSRVAELEDAVTRFEADRRAALAAQAAEMSTELARIRDRSRARDDELRRTLDEAQAVKRQLDEEKASRLRAESEAARVPDLASQLAKVERDLAADRKRLTETTAALESLQARQEEISQRELSLRTELSRAVSAALREVREIAFHAEGLEKSLEPVESRPRAGAKAPPAPEPEHDIEELAAEALRESLDGAEEKADAAAAADEEPTGHRGEGA